MSDRLTKSTLAPHAGSRFDVPDVDGLSFELVEVEGLPSMPADDDSFSMTFRAAGRSSLPQATYRLHHEDLGELDVFLVPIRQDEGGLYLQAIFNRAELRPAN
jgi:hypothetical protein